MRRPDPALSRLSDAPMSLRAGGNYAAAVACPPIITSANATTQAAASLWSRWPQPCHLALPPSYTSTAACPRIANAETTRARTLCSKPRRTCGNTSGCGSIGHGRNDCTSSNSFPRYDAKHRRPRVWRPLALARDCANCTNIELVRRALAQSSPPPDNRLSVVRQNLVIQPLGHHHVRNAMLDHARHCVPARCAFVV